MYVQLMGIFVWSYLLMSFIILYISISLSSLATQFSFNTLFYYSITSIFRFLWLLISFRFFLSIIIILSTALFRRCRWNLKDLSTGFAILWFVISGGCPSCWLRSIGLFLWLCFFVVLRFINIVLTESVIVQLVISINLLELWAQSLLWLRSWEHLL